MVKKKRLTGPALSCNMGFESQKTGLLCARYYKSSFNKEEVCETRDLVCEMCISVCGVKAWDVNGRPALTRCASRRGRCEPSAAGLGQGKFCGFVAAKGVGIKKDAGCCCLVPVSAISLPAGAVDPKSGTPRASKGLKTEKPIPLLFIYLSLQRP